MDNGDGEMSQAERKQEDKRDFRNSRKKVQMGADWASVDADLLRAVVAAVAAKDGALRLGYTSDGGCYAIGIYGDGAPYTEYVRPKDDVEGFLGELGEYFTDKERESKGSTKKAR